MGLFAESQHLPYVPLFIEGEIERIWCGAVRVLLATGFRVQNTTILERLERRGASVDWPREVFFPTAAMIEALASCARRNAAPRERAPILRRSLPDGNSVSYNGTLLYDWAGGVQRAATLCDVADMLKVCHVVPEVTDFGPTVTAQDVPPPIEPIVSFALGITLTDAPVHRVELVLPEQLPYLQELDSITQNRDVRYTYDGCAVNNFTVDSRAMSCLLATWQQNGLAEWSAYSCPVAGVSAPITIAGAVVVGVAETLGAWFAGWALNEDVQLTATPCSGVMDMKTARILFSTPETVLMDAGIFQVLDRVLGVRPYMLADYCDAKTPGLQAINDKVYKGLAYAWLTGQVNHQRGTLEAGKAFSPTQLVLDFEVNREIDQLARGVDVSDGALALELIEQNGPAANHTYLGSEHTARSFRAVQWLPRLFDRTCWESPAAERAKEAAILRKADARWRDALAAYQPPALDAGKVRAAHEVVRRACAQLGVGWSWPSTSI